MGIVFGITLQCFQRIGIISPGMGPAERGMDVLIILVQRFISAERIRLQDPGEALQEPLDIAPAPGHGVLVQDHWLLMTMLRGPVHEHIGLGIAAAPVLRHLAGGFVHLDHIGITMTQTHCRLSKDDEQRGESTSIGTQRSMMTDYCAEYGYEIVNIYLDDGYSGLNFNRPGFQELLDDIEQGRINLVITKDLSRLGRDYIMTGYYSEIYFPSKDVRYIAIADGFDSLNTSNEIAPFKNILNDMYARDISRKVKNAKRQHAKNGRLIASHAPYGYCKDEDGTRLIIDSVAAQTVRRIFALALNDLGEIAIAKELESQKIQFLPITDITMEILVLRSMLMLRMRIHTDGVNSTR